ncbi:ABC transporter permease [Pseudoalteromonas sp. MMG010]|uniref:ABC transporter permease n=1 Tax=Pseudoalteromonas sp. MMG010 TaxID=2822685 RepID=UPI001B3A7A93|nr:ABC transporter permease [Pseudoalteromonas sp. MMG010]MBQ4833488.1 ABC transporter permease [Pseudoalteromonas sp. MMG010]
MLIHTLKKEARLISHDLHSLAVLILMPVIFMIIMTLANSQSQQNMNALLTIKLIGAQNSHHSEVFAGLLTRQGFSISPQSKNELTLVKGVDALFLMRQGDSQIKLNLDANLAPQSRLLLNEKIKASLAQLKLYLYMLDTGDLDPEQSLEQQLDQVVSSADVGYLIAPQVEQPLENPALNSIPAWLVFGVYFIVLPMSLTFINERVNGTLIRLKTYPITMTRYFFNKGCAFMVVSFIQMAVLGLIGCICIPYFLGQPMLLLHDISFVLIAIVSVAAGAIAFALLIASIVTSFEQAMVVGGGVNIIIAALSGFMVPLELMPDNLALIAHGSPMYWSAQLLRYLMSDTHDSNFWYNIVLLWGFTVVCFLSALWIFNNKMRNLTWN